MNSAIVHTGILADTPVQYFIFRRLLHPIDHSIMTCYVTYTTPLPHNMHKV